MWFERLSFSSTLPGRAGALALIGLAAMACSDNEALDTLAGPDLAEADPASVVTQQEAALWELDPDGPGSVFSREFVDTPWGTATIKRRSNGVQVQVRVEEDSPLHELIAGNAITMWLGSFAHPDDCAPAPAGAPDTCSGSRGDLNDPAVGGARQFAGGKVLGNGPINLAVDIREGDTSDQDRGAPTEGLQNPEGAEIHFVIQTHGPPLPGHVDEQISESRGGCNPDCSTLAVAIFQAE